MWYVLVLVGLYVFALWILPFLLVPFTRKKLLPARIPRPLEEAIRRFEGGADGPYAYIVLCKEYILSTNHGGRFAAVRHLPLAFDRELSRLYARRGFMHCTQLNHLLRVMLVKSRFFTDEDVRIRTTILNLFFHQYLSVRIAGQWYDVDLGGDWLGVPLGKHAWGFR